MRTWVTRAVAIMRRHPTAVDIAMTVVLLAAGVALGLTEFHYVGQRQGDLLPPVAPTLWPVVGIAAIITPLAWRRLAPLPALVAAGGAYTASLLLLHTENEITGLALLMLLYSASAYGSDRWRTVVSAATSIVVAAVMAYNVGSDNVLMGAVFSVHVVVWQIAAYLLGGSVRVGRARQAELTLRTEQLAAERELNAHRAVLADRVRIARELHDVIAHHVSLMGIQAAAAGRVLNTRPDQATKALASIEVSSRQAVRELHRMVGFLRQDNEDDSLAPPPSLRHLDGLIGQLADATLDVQLHVEGQQVELPASVDLSAYRIVQEALTNTLKHARASTAEITLRYRPALFEIEVRDNGVGNGAAPGNGVPGRAGHGLDGMRERVALHRGRFEAGPRAEGGFGLRAGFPLEERT